VLPPHTRGRISLRSSSPLALCIAGDVIINKILPTHNLPRTYALRSTCALLQPDCVYRLVHRTVHACSLAGSTLIIVTHGGQGESLLPPHTRGSVTLYHSLSHSLRLRLSLTHVSRKRLSLSFSLSFSLSLSLSLSLSSRISLRSQVVFASTQLVRGASEAIWFIRV